MPRPRLTVRSPCARWRSEPETAPRAQRRLPPRTRAAPRPNASTRSTSLPTAVGASAIRTRAEVLPDRKTRISRPRPRETRQILLLDHHGILGPADRATASRELQREHAVAAAGEPEPLVEGQPEAAYPIEVEEEVVRRGLAHQLAVGSRRALERAAPRDPGIDGVGHRRHHAAGDRGRPSRRVHLDHGAEPAALGGLVVIDEEQDVGGGALALRERPIADRRDARSRFHDVPSRRVPRRPVHRIAQDRCRSRGSSSASCPRAGRSRRRPAPVPR